MEVVVPKYKGNCLFPQYLLCYLCICNIVFAILKGNNATAEMQDAKNFPNIRLFSAAEESSDTELIDLKGVGEYWSLPSQGISLKVVLRLVEFIKYTLYAG